MAIKPLGIFRISCDVKGCKSQKEFLAEARVKVQVMTAPHIAELLTDTVPEDWVREGRWERSVYYNGAGTSLNVKYFCPLCVNQLKHEEFKQYKGEEGLKPKDRDE